MTFGAAALTPGCMGDTGSGRTPTGTGSASPTGDGDCTELDQDVTIKSDADMATLPKTGCYDIYGTLSIQGGTVTSLAGLNGLNSVNELDLDHTALTAFDTKNDVGIYGKLSVTSNAKLTNLDKLSFVSASTGILIDSNPVLAMVSPLSVDDPKLAEVDGDVAITGNAALTAVDFKYLSKVTGAVTISNNPALKSIDLSQLATTGHVEVADNVALTSLSGFAATTINGDLAIHHNTVLTTLGTMSALYRVTGNLMIHDNAALTNLAAFTTSLKFVDQTLMIMDNAALTDLGDLKHLSLVGAITITGNADLLACRATEIDRCTQHPVASVINTNKTSTCTPSCN
ncbi:MAG TPA: hypothetical protein VH165_16010 [Kofleriaceae bacterium]|nr:hypothetical protein [Kofleriaceae bacterium]